jgi:hypothetical protein
MRVSTVMRVANRKPGWRIQSCARAFPLEQFAQILRSAAIKYMEHVGWKRPRDPHCGHSYILIESLRGISWSFHPPPHSRKTSSNHAKWSPSSKSRSWRWPLDSQPSMLRQRVERRPDIGTAARALAAGQGKHPSTSQFSLATNQTTRSPTWLPRTDARMVAKRSCVQPKAHGLSMTIRRTASLLSN